MGYVPPPSPALAAFLAEARARDAHRYVSEPCAYCDQPDPPRDSMRRCRNCGAPSEGARFDPLEPDRPAVMPIRLEETLNPGTR